jgi:hypothetical protein
VAAPTLVAAYSANSAGNSRVTSSLSLQSGDIVVVCGVSEGATAGDSFNAPTTTFATGGITQLQLHAAASNSAAAAWTFTVSTTASGTVTLTQSGAVAGNAQLTVTAWRGGVAPTVARSSWAASATRTLSYTSSQANSGMTWIVGDWAAIAAQALAPTSTTHSSASPGPTAMPQSSVVGTSYTQYAAVLDDQALTSAVGYGIGGTGTGPFSIIVVEVQGTGGAAAPNPRRPAIANRVALIRASNF